MTWLIAGLGNPGKKYQMTRHNIGFIALDYLAQGWGGGGTIPEREEHKALTRKVTVEDKTVILAKPQTFMNLSGEAVQALMHFYKIPKENLLVVHDEVDFPFNNMKFHKNRSPGGNNGVKSISQMLGDNDYTRLRLGVGRPPHPEMSVADYVLQNFSKEEMVALPDYLNRACDAVEAFIFDGLSKASSQFNN
ncbi:MAG: aminoacyl-tRNA hydrolase [Pseudobdellovibrionaceae bacterium]